MDLAPTKNTITLEKTWGIAPKITIKNVKGLCYAMIPYRAINCEGSGSIIVL